MLNIFRNFVLMKPAKSKNEIQLPSGYNEWRKKIEVMIETSKLSSALHVNVGFHPVSDRLYAVLVWCGAGHFLEPSAEVLWVWKAEAVGYLAD